MERKEGLPKGCNVEPPGASKIFLLGWEGTGLLGAGCPVRPRWLYPGSGWIEVAETSDQKLPNDF